MTTASSSDIEETVGPDRPSRSVAGAIGRHPRRVFSGGPRATRVSAAEERLLVSAGVVDPLVQRYLAWRHSLLLVAVPFVVLSGALAVRDLVTIIDTPGLTRLGSVANLIPSSAVVVLMVATLIATFTWHRPRRSARVLQTGWLISLAAPVLVAVVPVNWFVTESALEQFGDGTEFATRVYISVSYALALLPTMLSFPAGVVRGATRIKALLPGSTLAGWVLLFLAPIYALFFVLAFVVVEQLAGNAVLLGGIALLAASPFVHLFAARLYILPLTTDAEFRRLARVQRRTGILTVAGGVMLVVWALTAKVDGSALLGATEDGAFISHWAALLRVLEFVSRVLITSAVFGHLLLQITEASWRYDRGYVDAEGFRRHEEQMAQLEHALRATGDQVG